MEEKNKYVAPEAEIILTEAEDILLLSVEDEGFGEEESYYIP